MVNTTIRTVNEVEEEILDSKASGHYGERKTDPYCSEVSDTLTPKPVQVANVEDMQASKGLILQLLDKLSDKSQRGYTYNDIKTGTLFSVGKLADNDCVSIFS